MSDYAYVGTELALFAAAQHWKAYWSSVVRPFVSGHVLEVGAGIGTNTLTLCEPNRHRWTCLEPDASLAQRLREAVASLGSAVQVTVGTTRDLPAIRSFDSILYIDVLEHIDDDRGELQHAAELLRPGGHLIVLAPAHQFLYSAFDKAIGHYRRYSRTDLLGVAPATLPVQRAVYLDTAGLAASLANRLALRQALPNASQIRIWDRAIVPISRVVDPLLGFTCGKSIVVVWRTPAV